VDRNVGANNVRLRVKGRGTWQKEDSILTDRKNDNYKKKRLDKLWGGVLILLFSFSNKYYIG
jgi:hypothetical protein